MYTETIGGGNDVQTLATAILSRVQGTPTTRQYHQIASEVDGSDDTLLTIDASVEALVDGEFLTLQRANSDEIITVTNSAALSEGVDLEGTDDFLFANDFDTLVLQWNAVADEWRERERFATGL